MKYVLTVMLIVALASCAMAAKVQTNPIVHDDQLVYQAYPGSSRGNTAFTGLIPVIPAIPVISSAPGILQIVPQFGTNPAWSNFVSAFQAQVPYTIKNVVLRKVVPEMIQCSDRYAPKVVPQQGTPNIRLWWPLMYEVPGTTWTLTITYGTPTWADPANPGHPSTVHQDIWVWRLHADLTHLSYLLELFHEIPFGLDEVPLISDEVLYPELQAMVAEIQALLSNGLLDQAGDALAEFELEVSNRCITLSPESPVPTAFDTGIANSLENPACCKILLDCEYIGFDTGIFAPSK